MPSIFYYILAVSLSAPQLAESRTRRARLFGRWATLARLAVSALSYSYIFVFYAYFAASFFVRGMSKNLRMCDIFY